MIRWWAEPEAVRKALAVVDDSDVEQGVGTAVLGLHGLLAESLEPLRGQTLVDSADVIGRITSTDVTPAAEAITKALSADLGPASVQYGQSAAADLQERAAESAQALLTSWTSQGVSWPAAVERLIDVVGVPTTHTGGVAKSLAAPAVPAVVRQDMADRALMSYAAQRGMLEASVHGEVSKERVRERWDEADHPRDSDGQFRTKLESERVREQEREKVRVADKEKERQAREARRRRRERRGAAAAAQRQRADARQQEIVADAQRMQEAFQSLFSSERVRTRQEPEREKERVGYDREAVREKAAREKRERIRERAAQEKRERMRGGGPSAGAVGRVNTGLFVPLTHAEHSWLRKHTKAKGIQGGGLSQARGSEFNSLDNTFYPGNEFIDLFHDGGRHDTNRTKWGALLYFPPGAAVLASAKSSDDKRVSGSYQMGLDSFWDSVLYDLTPYPEDIAPVRMTRIPNPSITATSARNLLKPMPVYEVLPVSQREVEAKYGLYDVKQIKNAR